MNPGFLPSVIFSNRKSPAAASGGSSLSQGITRSGSFTGDTIMKFVNPKETLHCQRINYEKNWLLSCQQEKRGLKKKKKALKAKQGYKERLPPTHPSPIQPRRKLQTNKGTRLVKMQGINQNKFSAHPLNSCRMQARCLPYCFIFAFICLELATLLSLPSSAATTCRLD